MALQKEKELDSYQLMVDEKAEEKSTDILANAGKDHAAIVMAKMFEKANSANMIVGSFDGKVSEQANYIEQLKVFLAKDNVSLKIIFLDEPNTKSTALKLIREKQFTNKNIVIKQASKEVVNRLKKNDCPVHYSVFDDDKYRYEKDTEKYLALFSFNDKKIAATLLNIFNESFEKSAIV